MGPDEIAGIRRRDLLKWGSALGLTLPFGGVLLSACGASTQSTVKGGSGSTDLSAFTSSKIDWKSQSGKTIVLGVLAHPWVTAIQPQLAQFQSLTGINVQLPLAGEDTYVQKLPVTMASGSPTPDVLMVPAYGQAVQAGWLQPLDDYFSNSKLTDLAWYKQSDVLPSAADFVKWQGKTTYGLPITAEVQITFYRDDLITDAAPLSTFEGLQAAAVSAKTAGNLAGGIALRGKPTAGELAWPAAGYVFSYGGYIIDPSGKAALDSPETVAGVQMYADIVKAAAPKGVSTADWIAALAEMQQGQVAMFQDSSNASSDLRDPSKSKVAASIKAAPFPAHNGKSNPNIWHWILGMNSKGQNKDAAWLFMQWATSAPASNAIAAAGGTPPRVSAWQNPKFQTAYGPEIAASALKSLQSTDSKPMTAAWMNPKWPEVGQAFATAVNIAFTSGESAQSALSAAQKTAQAALA